MTSCIQQRAIDADAKNSVKLTRALSIMLERAIVTAQVAARADNAVTAKAAATVLIDHEILVDA